jgi:hypothetical protein
MRLVAEELHLFYLLSEDVDSSVLRWERREWGD